MSRRERDAVDVNIDSPGGEEYNTSFTMRMASTTGDVNVSIQSLLLPPSAKRGVQLHQREQLLQPGPRQLQLGIEEVRLAGQHFQIAGDAAAIADIRQSRRVASCRHELRELPPEHERLLVADE